MSDGDTRKEWMGLLARASSEALDELWRAFGLAPSYTVLRAPEVGGVMVRGRAGASGAAFNLGEMTVTRCAVQLENGVVGHGYVQGRNKTHAIEAALVDALMQGPMAKPLREAVLTPLADAEKAERASRAAKAAATRVEFFTLVRGED